MATPLSVLEGRGPDGNASVDWGREPSWRSRASSLLDRPTGGGKGGDATRDDGAGESDGVDAWRSVRLNGVTVIDESGLTNEGFRLRLRFRASKAAPIASEAATPMVPPAIAPACKCDFDEAPVVTGLAVICRTGTLRNGKSLEMNIGFVVQATLTSAAGTWYLMAEFVVNPIVQTTGSCVVWMAPRSCDMATTVWLKMPSPGSLIYAVITLDLIGSAKPGPRSRQRPCLSDIVVNDARHN